MKTWKKTRVSGAKRVERLWGEILEIQEGKTMWNLEGYAQMFDFVLRVNMMLLNNFKQGSWTILQGSGLGRGKERQSPDHRKLHNTLQRRPPLEHFGLSQRKGRVPSTCECSLCVQWPGCGHWFWVQPGLTNGPQGSVTTGKHVAC